MALRPGGPLGDYVSQTQYATERVNQPAAPQAEDQQAAKQQIAPNLAASSFSRDLQPESPKLTPEERTAAYNESIAERNNAERAEKLGQGQQAEQADEKKNAYRELAQQVAAQQKQEGPHQRQQERQPELGD
jgi:hypothetical protein